jgi:hypothetical protein
MMWGETAAAEDVNKKTAARALTSVEMLDCPLWKNDNCILDRYFHLTFVFSLWVSFKAALDNFGIRFQHAFHGE